jgi:hypothetical protein
VPSAFMRVTTQKRCWFISCRHLTSAGNSKRWQKSQCFWCGGTEPCEPPVWRLVRRLWRIQSGRRPLSSDAEAAAVQTNSNPAVGTKMKDAGVAEPAGASVGVGAGMPHIHEVIVDFANIGIAPVALSPVLFRTWRRIR